MATLVQLDFDKPTHQATVARMVLSSTLQYGADDIHEDSRLSLWRERRGIWVVAVDGQRLAGVAVVEFRNRHMAELVWLEVAESYRGVGIGRMLFDWSRAHAPTLTWLSTEQSVGFYEHVLRQSAPRNRRFVVTTPRASKPQPALPPTHRRLDAFVTLPNLPLPA